MSKTAKIPLTKQDALEKMCSDIKEIAREVRYGKIWYPTMENPSIICEVHDGTVTMASILFNNAGHDKDGRPIVPDRSVQYRSD